MRGQDEIVALVEAIRSGAVQRYSEVVRRFDDDIRRIVRRSVGDPASQEELVQQVFYQGFKNLEALKSGKNLGAWLKQIARRAVADHHRRPRDRMSAELPILGDEDARSREWIWEEVDTLTQILAEVLKLRYRDGCSYRDIARRLDVSLSTVRGRIYEARRALRERLDQGDVKL